MCSLGSSAGGDAQKRRRPGKGALEGQGSGGLQLGQGQGQGQGSGAASGGVPGAGQAQAQHIPYRDSKLTRILQQALGGNGRTLILGCVSPSLAHLDHTRNTLAFATAARLVRTAARVNVVCLSHPPLPRTISCFPLWRSSFWVPALHCVVGL